MKWTPLLWLLALPLAIALLWLLVPTWAARLTHPYDLEWMEGGMLAHAWRLQHGLPLYPEPGPEWVPYVYPPGYAAVLAALGQGGLSHALGRAVSLVGTAVAAGSITWIVGRHGAGPHRWPAGLAAALFLLGTYTVTGAFMDLVRPDALSLGLLMLSVALALEERPWAQLAGGGLLALAFLVKHHAAAYGLPIALGLWARHGRIAPALRYGLAAVVPAGLATLALEASTGTFLAYLLQAPASHGIKGPRAFPGTAWEWSTALSIAGLSAGIGALGAALQPWSRRTRLAVGLGVVTVGGVLGVVLNQRASKAAFRWPWDDVWVRVLGVLDLGFEPVGGAVVGGPVPTAIGWLALTALGVAPLLAALRLRRSGHGRGWVLATGVGLVALVTAALMRGHVGGFVNVLLPLYAFTAVGAGLGLCWLAARTWLHGWLGPALAVSLAALQLGVGVWSQDVERLIPTAADRAAGDALVERLRHVEGPVWSPVAPWLPVQAGHAPGPPLIAVWDVARYPDGPFPDAGARFEEAIREGWWGTIVDGSRPLRFGVQRNYRVLEDLHLGSALAPRTGWRNKPERLMVPATRRGAPRDGAASGR